jgi:hypothetical protein
MTLEENIYVQIAKTVICEANVNPGNNCSGVK